MIDMSLQQSDPVALSHRSPGRLVRSVAGYSLLMALMFRFGLVAFVPAVVLYCGIRLGMKSTGLSLAIGAVVATLFIFAEGSAPDLMRFDFSGVTAFVLALGIPALAAIPMLQRGESFGRMFALLVVGSVLGLFATELLWRMVAGFSPYATEVALARKMAVDLVAMYRAAKTPPDAVRMMERWFDYYNGTLTFGTNVIQAAVCFLLSLLMVGRLPAVLALAARRGDTRGTYLFRNLVLPEWVLFLFVFGGLAPLVTGLAHQVAANALTLAVFLYVVQGFALLRYLLASLGIGFVGALAVFLVITLTVVGLLPLGLAGLFDPFFDFRHFKKRKDDSHESHSD
jgi:hypothetical protein